MNNREEALSLGEYYSPQDIYSFLRLSFKKKKNHTWEVTHSNDPYGCNYQVQLPNEG